MKIGKFVTTTITINQTQMTSTPYAITTRILCFLLLGILSLSFSQSVEAATGEEITTVTAPTQEIFFVLTENTNIFNAFDVLKQMELNVKELNGFYVETTGSEATVSSLKQGLKAKAYLSAKSDIYDDAVREPEVSYKNGRIIVKLSFFNLTSTDMDDFVNFMKTNNLKISDGDVLPYKWGLANANGDTTAMAAKMKGHPLVQLAKQNKVVGVK